MDPLTELLATITAAGALGPTPDQWLSIWTLAGLLKDDLAERAPKSPDLSTLDRSRIAHVGPPPTRTEPTEN